LLSEKLNTYKLVEPYYIKGTNPDGFQFLAGIITNIK
jgi:hypothetical protein